ncbi:MAG: hypothetical protein KME28_17375 [Pelatocladus maniniholoensis HA4357-MV3]|jgi:hypothetical protein|uniref:Uncharacterized protein n=1 Tax=Pelatocladus maniniholoensis HA4357-MV3 TaxID=1117104 RepID=A0A9E3LU40_9NOST|nr:hypothetical protein [Pelatocladus maniniholoensis HA4357-MV3]
MKKLGIGNWGRWGPSGGEGDSRVVSYEKIKIWKSVFIVLKHRFLPLSKPLPLIRGEALKEDFNFSLLV